MGVAMFGSDYGAQLKNQYKDEKELDRQLQRIELTQYTTRELLAGLENGPTGLAAAVKQNNLQQAVDYYRAVGDAEFATYVAKEGERSNWTKSEVAAFTKEVAA